MNEQAEADEQAAEGESLLEASAGEQPRPDPGSDSMDPLDRTLDEDLDESDEPRSVEALEAELQALREQSLRAKADYQNLKRRTQSDYEAGLKRTLQPLIDELLLVLDYLELALASPTTTDEARNLATGVEMTRVKLLQALESIEVHPIPAGGTFDPRLHDATASRAEADAEPGTILATTRKGYTWRELVLRPAQVVVAAAPETDAAGERG